jgi:hypothetical protein
MEEETNIFMGKDEFPKVSLDNLKNQGSSLHKVTNVERCSTNHGKR